MTEDRPFLVVTAVGVHVVSRLQQHRDNLMLWENGYLSPTEPDEEEREAVKRELRAAINELEMIWEIIRGET